MSRRRAPRTALALFAGGAFLGALAAPILRLAESAAPASFCCARGRCCCSGTPADGDRTCLRRSCGCEGTPAVTTEAPLRADALLPRLRLPGPGEPAAIAPAAGTLSVPSRAHEPPVPPPKA